MSEGEPSAIVNTLLELPRCELAELRSLTDDGGGGGDGEGGGEGGCCKKKEEVKLRWVARKKYRQVAKSTHRLRSDERTRAQTKKMKLS